MPLSEPKPRRHYHTRKVECFGYLREDGLWDIEGHIKDTKTYNFDNRSFGEIKAGEGVHDMWMRLTVDDTMTVHDIEAVTDRSPFQVCGEIAPAYRKLIGLKIGPGWTRAVKQTLGGTNGCTHLTELLGPIATVAFQTVYASRPQAEKEGRKPPRQPSLDENGNPRKPPQVDDCHALRSDGEVVKSIWPEFHRAADKAVGGNE